MRSKGFFYNLAGFVFVYFCDSGRILATFTKFVSIRFSQHDRFVLHVIQRARAQAPLHLPRMLFDTKLYKPLPLSHFFCAHEAAQSPHENSMSGANMRSALARFGDNNWEDFVKTFTSKNLCGRWRGAWACARWMMCKTVRSCCEKQIETKLCKSR